MSKFISFTAYIGTEEVRITCSLKDVEIVSRDNHTTYNVEENADKLDGIEFEQIY